MPGFASIQEMVDAELNGAVRYSTWRKTPNQVTASGFWFDLSMSPGNPAPQYYAATPVTAARLAQSTDGGIFHGGVVSPARKFITRLTALTVTAAAVPMSMILCDYLLYYPFIDEGEDTVAQTMVNTNTIPRYTDGAGVRMMAVAVAGHVGGGPSFFVEYTNSAGVAGRISATVTLNTQVVNGTILTTAPATAGCFGPFIPLQTGDTGVRSIDTVRMNTPDSGLFTLVLVKPLAQMSIRGIDAPVEVNYLTDFAQLPRIYDDAYLNFICHPGGSLTGAPIHGDATFIWG